MTTSGGSTTFERFSQSTNKALGKIYFSIFKGELKLILNHHG
jgi:hypothetical protein